MISIQEEDFSVDEVLKRLQRKGTGGVAFFLGVVREGEDESIREILVEAYREAALKELQRLREEAVRRFALIDTAILHRVGRLHVGENIVLIVASAPHRREALQACDFLISQLKLRVPIWKKEIGSRGESWVVNSSPLPERLGASV